MFLDWQPCLTFPVSNGGSNSTLTMAENNFPRSDAVSTNAMSRTKAVTRLKAGRCVLAVAPFCCSTKMLQVKRKGAK